MVENIYGDTLTPRDKSVYQKETDTVCPQCNQEKLFILSSIENSVTVECPRCRYTEHKSSDEFVEMTDMHGRPVKTPS